MRVMQQECSSGTVSQESLLFVAARTPSPWVAHCVPAGSDNQSNHLANSGGESYQLGWPSDAIVAVSVAAEISFHPRSRTEVASTIYF